MLRECLLRDHATVAGSFEAQFLQSEKLETGVKFKEVEKTSPSFLFLKSRIGNISEALAFVCDVQQTFNMTISYYDRSARKEHSFEFAGVWSGRPTTDFGETSTTLFWN